MHVRRVPLRRQGERAGGRVDPGVESVDQHHPAGRRRRRGQQERVIATRPHTGRRSGRESAEAVWLEPLRVIVDGKGHAIEAREYAPPAVLARKPLDARPLRICSDIDRSSAHRRAACAGVSLKPGISRNSLRTRWNRCAMSSCRARSALALSISLIQDLGRLDVRRRTWFHTPGETSTPPPSSKEPDARF
jgi:hypothetical protein